MSDENIKDWYDIDGWDYTDDPDNPFIHEEKEITFYENPRLRPDMYARPQKNLFDTPRGIFEYLDANIYGHTECKRQLAFFVWQIKHDHHPAALLIAGNSGEGKTETIRALQKIYHNITVTDGASITPQGYKGNNKLASALNMLDLDNPAQPPIFVIDEIDKLICRGGAWSDTELTGELLKLMEDGVLDISVNDRNQRIISTENISFILLGSFSHLTDQTKSRPIGFNASLGDFSAKRKTLTIDMIRDTLSPELQGRIGNIVVLDPFDQEDFERILKDGRYSPINRYEMEYHLHIKLSPVKCRQIAASAYANHTGVRSMRNEIEAHIREAIFNDPSIKEIVIK